MNDRRQACKALVAALEKTYDYVSVLGSDCRGTVVSVNKQTETVGEGGGQECGFVVKMTSGQGYWEYSLDDIAEDPDVLATRIVSELTVADKLVPCLQPARLEREHREESWTRPSDLEDYDTEVLVAHGRSLRDTLLGMDSHIVNAYVRITAREVSKLFVAHNTMLDQNYAWINGMVMTMYRADDGRMVSAREGAYGHLMSTVLAELPTKLDKLVDKARHLATATAIVPGVYDVITDPSISGLIAHEAFGHGVEMDMFVKDRALAKQYVGQQVASPIVNMRDGAAACLSAASYFFDDDGVPAQNTQIIKNGVLVAGLSDRASAGALGTQPTGNGRRESYKRKAYARMTNTFFEKGTDKLEDMIASIEHGYMLFETNNGMEDPKTWAIQCTAEYGIEIVNGKLTDHYVSPVVLSGYVPDVLKNISMVSDEVEICGSGMCGKGYKEWVYVADGGPALKTRVKLG